MRVLEMKDVPSIHLAAGDSIQLTYRKDWKCGGFLLHTDERELAAHVFDRPCIVDRVAVVEYDDGELATLGMKRGFAGVFGERA